MTRPSDAARDAAAAAEADLVADRLEVAGVVLDVLRPRDPEALVSDEAFAQGEFLPYWATLWPSAPVLAERLAERGVRGLPVLELGCGLGVTGLAAAALGADVTATDWAGDALLLLARNAERNGLRVAARRLDWFAPADAPLFADPEPAPRDGWPTVSPHDGRPTGAPRDGWSTVPPRDEWPLVLAADVLYEARNRESLLATLDRVVAPDGEAWIAEPGRRSARAFWPLAAAAGWEVTELAPRAGEESTVRILRR